MENNSVLESENAFLKSQVAQLQNKIQQLEEFIHQLHHKQFGTSSEKRSPDQIALFNEAETLVEEAPMAADESNAVNVPAHTRSKKRVSIPATLPREEIIHDLPEREKLCPKDGTALKHVGDEVSEQLDIIPAQVKVLHHIRRKYACPCCEQYLITASKPPQPIEKSFASPGLLAYITTQKYVDALPLYRQVDIFGRIGIDMDRTTLANWMIRCGELIQPLINLIHEKMLSETVLHMDETVVQVLNEIGKTPQSQSYMWVLRSISNPAVIFHYSPSRSSEIPKTLLPDYTQALMVDGYEGYNAVCNTQPITRLGCWAHVRRKFIEAQKVQPKNKTGRADQALAYIQQLYRIEQEAKEKSSVERQQHRQHQAQPIIDKLKIWLEKSLPNVPPQIALGKAFHYLHTQWPRLIHYVNNGDYPIDNNAAENAIRPFVIGRKNWLFSARPQGAKASANLYSLIETAKANGFEPYAYLKQIFTELPKAKIIEDVEALLPWNLKSVVG